MTGRVLVHEGTLPTRDPPTCHSGPAHATRRCSCCCRRVLAAQTPTVDPEPLPQKSPPSHAMGSTPSRFRLAFRPPRTHSENCGRTQALDVPEIPSGSHEAQISPALCIRMSAPAGPERTLPRTHRGDCGDETSQSPLRLSTDCARDCACLWRGDR